jgi:hypothetical protein
VVIVVRRVEVGRVAVEVCARIPRALQLIRTIVEAVEVFALVMGRVAVAVCARTGPRCLLRMRRTVEGVGMCVRVGNLPARVGLVLCIKRLSERRNN